MADRNMVQRVAFAAVAIPLALLLVWLGGWPLAALVAAVGVLGVQELYDLAAKLEVHAATALGLATHGDARPAHPRRPAGRAVGHGRRRGVAVRRRALDAGTPHLDARARARPRRSPSPPRP